MDLVLKNSSFNPTELYFFMYIAQSIAQYNTFNLK